MLLYLIAPSIYRLRYSYCFPAIENCFTLLLLRARKSDNYCCHNSWKSDTDTRNEAKRLRAATIAMTKLYNFMGSNRRNHLIEKKSTILSIKIKNHFVCTNIILSSCKSSIKDLNLDKRPIFSKHLILKIDNSYFLCTYNIYVCI